MLFFRKKRKNVSLLITCRNLGKWHNSKKEDVYFLKSNGKVHQLFEESYQCFKWIGEVTTKQEWKEKLYEEKLIESEKDFSQIYTYFLKKKIFTEIENERDDVLEHIIVSRNGVGKGKIESNWYIGTYSDSQKLLKFTDKQFQIWMQGNGIATAKEMIDAIAHSFQCSIVEAFNLWINLGREYEKKGFWNIEYEIAEPQNTRQSVPKEKFQLQSDSIFITIGQEVGVINDFETNHWISNGKRSVKLNPAEYAVWTILRNEFLNLSQLAQILDTPLDYLSKEIIQPLIEKKVLLQWSYEDIEKSTQVVAVASGICFTSSRSKVVVASSPLADREEIDVPLFLIWSNTSPNRSIKDMLKLFMEETKSTLEEAKEAIYTFLPVLIQKELLTLVAKEDRR